MKKTNILAFLIGLTLIVSAVISIYAQSGVKGYVVSLTDVYKGTESMITVDRAKELHSAGQPLAFKSGNNVYIVVNPGMNIDAKNLVRNAGKEITIQGDVKNVKGFSYLLEKSYN